jgi:hypothetical protein
MSWQSQVVSLRTHWPQLAEAIAQIATLVCIMLVLAAIAVFLG